MTLDGLGPLLDHNPNVKVLHLTRDPRAIIHSRIETSGHPLRGTRRDSRDIIQTAKALCDKMKIDLDEGLKLKERYPDRLRFIHYEDLLLRDESIRRLYEFIGMKFDSVIFRRVFAIKTNAPERKDGVKEKDRRTNNALWWRSYLKYEVVQQVDKECQHLYPKLGYPIIYNSTQLRNVSKEDLLLQLKFKL